MPRTPAARRRAASRASPPVTSTRPRRDESTVTRAVRRAVGAPDPGLAGDRQASPGRPDPGDRGSVPRSTASSAARRSTYDAVRVERPAERLQHQPAALQRALALEPEAAAIESGLHVHPLDSPRRRSGARRGARRPSRRPRRCGAPAEEREPAGERRGDRVARERRRDPRARCGRRAARSASVSPRVTRPARGDGPAAGEQLGPKRRAGRSRAGASTWPDARRAARCRGARSGRRALAPLAESAERARGRPAGSATASDGFPGRAGRARARRRPCPAGASAVPGTAGRSESNRTAAPGPRA